MKSKRNKSLPAVVEEMQTEMKGWRERKRPGERIPEELWCAAARAARRHGVHLVSRALGLDYKHLKRRLGQKEESGHGAGIMEAVFVELDGGPTRSGAGCVVELEKGNGTRMRICVRDAAQVDWCRMKEAFLGA